MSFANRGESSKRSEISEVSTASSAADHTCGGMNLFILFAICEHIQHN